jgi:hypothetical protein
LLDLDLSSLKSFHKRATEIEKAYFKPRERK